MKFKLKVWRQKNKNVPGQLVDYNIDNINADMSFLEMIDVLSSTMTAVRESAGCAACI
jgi:succinate dehydrogenase / fumarate reductase iron-sulfur subunit